MVVPMYKLSFYASYLNRASLYDAMSFTSELVQ